MKSSLRDIFAVLSSIAMLFSAQITDVSSRDFAAHTLRSLLQVRDLRKPENSSRSLSNAVLIDTTFVFKIVLAPRMFTTVLCTLGQYLILIAGPGRVVALINVNVNPLKPSGFFTYHQV